MTYTRLQKNRFSHGPYELVPLREQDIFAIREWRNNQLSILRQQAPLTEEMQKKYFETVVKPSFSAEFPQQMLFSYLFKGDCIGYGGIVHIDWHSHRGEVSFLLDTHRVKDSSHYAHDFAIFLQLIKQIAFDELHFHRLFTETFDMRPTHISVLESQGFILEGRMKEHVLIDGNYIDSLIHGCIKHG
jgi:RimJ/RimL family protein N-acetyltransferase